MKLIETVNAVGHVLCHDLTRIVPGVTKDAAFRKGHIVTEEDIPMLLSMGKEHLYVWEKTEGVLHENEAAERLRAICQNANMSSTPVKEGKIELIADIDGLFRVDVARLNAINALDEVMIATRHTNTTVRRGDKLAGTRVIPLVVDEARVAAAEAAAGETPLLELLPYRRRTAAIVTTGNEVFLGRIEDAFTPVLIQKLAAFGVEAVSQVKVPDERGKIVAAVCRPGGRRGADSLHGRHERGPRRPDSRGHQSHRGENCLLRRARPPRRYVPAGVLRGRHPHHGTARLRHVRQGHRL